MTTTDPPGPARTARTPAGPVGRAEAHADRRSDQRSLVRELRTLLVAWLSLITLMLLTLGGAYLSLGAGNLALALAIAVAKAAIVGWWFMELREASSLVRLVAAAGLGALGLLFALGLVDEATRPHQPAVWQTPMQVKAITAPAR
jgi:cytochrome c oxidase subunit 4